MQLEVTGKWVNKSWHFCAPWSIAVLQNGLRGLSDNITDQLQCLRAEHPALWGVSGRTGLSAPSGRFFKVSFQLKPKGSDLLPGAFKYSSWKEDVQSFSNNDLRNILQNAFLSSSEITCMILTLFQHNEASFLKHNFNQVDWKCVM